MVTLVPTGPDAGVKLEIVGVVAPVALLSAALVAVPLAAAPVLLPVVLPEGTVAVIWMLELTVNAVAAVPLNCTPVAPVKLVPLMVTLVPTGPDAGVKPVIVGVV